MNKTLTLCAALCGSAAAAAQQPGDAEGQLNYKQGEITFVMGSMEPKRWLLLSQVSGASFFPRDATFRSVVGEDFFRKFAGTFNVAALMFTPDGGYPREQSIELGVLRDRQTGQLVLRGLDILAPPDFPRAIYHKVYPLKCELRASVAANGSIQGSGSCETLGEREPRIRFTFAASPGGGR